MLRGPARPAELWDAASGGCPGSYAVRDPQALPEHALEWVNAICAGGGYGDATRLYEFDDGRRFVLPLVFRRGRQPGRQVAVLGDRGPT